MRSTARCSIETHFARSAAWVLLATIAGCAPTTNVGGVYFPAWLISVTIGVVGTYAAVLALGRSPKTRALADSGLLFIALVAGISMASWLSLYSGF